MGIALAGYKAYIAFLQSMADSIQRGEWPDAAPMLLDALLTAASRESFFRPRVAEGPGARSHYAFGWAVNAGEFTPDALLDFAVAQGVHHLGVQQQPDAGLGQHVRGVDQGFLGGLADAGFGFTVDGIEDEPGGETDDQEVAEEEADGNIHGRLRRPP